MSITHSSLIIWLLFKIFQKFPGFVQVKNSALSMVYKTLHYLTQLPFWSYFLSHSPPFSNHSGLLDAPIKIITLLPWGLYICFFLYLGTRKRPKIKTKSRGEDLQDGWGVRPGDHLPPHKYIKYIYMWNNSYRTATERWQKTSDFPKGKKLLMYLGRQKKKEKTETKE